MAYHHPRYQLPTSSEQSIHGVAFEADNEQDCLSFRRICHHLIAWNPLIVIATVSLLYV